MNRYTAAEGDHGVSCVLDHEREIAPVIAECGSFTDALTIARALNGGDRIRAAADVHRCNDCGLPTSHAIGSYWLADDALWSQVTAGAAFVLCPACFYDRAGAAGVTISWRAVRDDV